MDNNGNIVVSTNGGIPKMVGLYRENPLLKWMMTGGTPISGNHQMNLLVYSMYSDGIARTPIHI